MEILLLGVMLLVAYANGANDNFKGVATLLGSRTTTYRGALTWGTACTFAGSACALVLAGGLIKAFSGKGLVPDSLAGQPAFLVAVGLGAGLTVLLATLTAFPISTTHALTGALVGAGLTLAGDVRLGVLGSKFFLPLAVSPLLAVLGTGLIYPPMRWIRQRLGLTPESCVCVGAGDAPALAASDGVAARSADSQALSAYTCGSEPPADAVAVGAQGVLDRAHYLAAGAVSFARGLNDTPKIAALLLATPLIGVPTSLILVGVMMAAGAMLSARKVARTMSHEITTMNHGQGFAANAVTAALVIGASRLGVPVSTTHVSCGALFGLGGVTGQARWRRIGQILLAWLVTLPLAAALAALAASII